MDFVYKFPVVRGIQAGREYYIAMIPLRMLGRLFPDEDEYVLPEYRAQRKLNEARIPVISRYITENKKSYVFSALAASIDGEFNFISVDENGDVGTLEVSLDARFLINDGQHRKAAILDALNEAPEIGSETISVVLYEDVGLARSQQIFTDLNKHAVKTSNSISELYDSRDYIAVLTRNVVANVNFLNDYTDKEKDNLGKYSSNLFTLNTFYNANKRILSGRKLNEDTYESVYEFVNCYWKYISENMLQWNELMNREISKVDLRENYIVTQGVVIQSLGRIGAFFFDNQKLDMKNYLQKLRDIDWRRGAPIWKFRVIRADGKILTSNKAIILTANQIKKELGIILNHEEKAKEKQFLENMVD